MLTKLVRLGCAALASLAAMGASAQNLVVNGDFADDLAGWENVGGSTQWNSFDAGDSPSSGSLRIGNPGAAGSTRYAEQCFPVEPGMDLVLGVSHYNVAPIATGRADVRLLVHANSLCEGTSTFFDSIVSDVEGEWTRLDYEFTTGAGVHAIRLRLGSAKQSGSDEDAYTVYFDDVEVPEPGDAGGAAIGVLALITLRARAYPENPR